MTIRRRTAARNISRKTSSTGWAVTEWADLPPVPPEVLSAGGHRVLLHRDRAWRVPARPDGGTLLHIRLGLLEGDDSTPGRYTDRALRLLALYVVDRLQRRNPRTSENDFRTFRHFARWRAVAGSSGCFEWTHLTEAMARSYLVHCLTHSAEKGNHLSRLRVFYEWGVAGGYADFDRATLRVLKAIQAPGNAKGQAVRFRSPTHGPLTRDEVRQISDALQRGAGRPEDRAVVMLHLEFGANPSAFGRLQNRDLLSFSLPDTTAGVKRLWQLDVPRVKKRNSASREVKRRPISPQLGELLHSLRRGAADDPLLWWLHRSDPERSLREALRRFPEIADLISPRTGERLRLTPRRLRYTFATHLAEDGASPVHLAELLDHSDLQHVGVYTELTSRVTDTIARTTDHVIVPLVNRFLGLVTDEQPDGRSRPVVPADAPHLVGLTGESTTADATPILTGIGACRRDVVRDGLCERLPPLACYRCDRFAAFRTGPHASVLSGIERAQRALAARGSDGDRRLAVQLEEARGAVTALLLTIGASSERSPSEVIAVATT